MTGFQNGTFQELSEMVIPITSTSINRGYGAYEFFEVINKNPFYGERHLARFRNTLHLLKLHTVFYKQLPEIIMELIDRTQLSDFYIKMFALPHKEFHDGNYEASLYIYPVQISGYDGSLYEKGAYLLIKDYARFMPEAKSTNYLAGQYWSDEISNRLIVDILFCCEGLISETSRGNIFRICNGKVTTPGQKILKGITRSIVIDILTGMGIPFEETDIQTNELLDADEIFISSTLKNILPITQIDNTIIGNGLPGEITRKLMAGFQIIKESFRKQQ
jgi:branched-chain amino acid aminotransferase